MRCLTLALKKRSPGNFGRRTLHQIDDRPHLFDRFQGNNGMSRDESLWSHIILPLSKNFLLWDQVSIILNWNCISCLGHCRRSLNGSCHSTAETHAEKEASERSRVLWPEETGIDRNPLNGRNHSGEGVPERLTLYLECSHQK
jgi:hypothetical protein